MIESVRFLLRWATHGLDAQAVRDKHVAADLRALASLCFGKPACEPNAETDSNTPTTH